jgi:hypothetical protein
VRKERYYRYIQLHQFLIQIVNKFIEARARHKIYKAVSDFMIYQYAKKPHLTLDGRHQQYLK